MHDEPEPPEPDNVKWIGAASVSAVVVFGLAAWVRSLPLDDFPAFAALAVLLAGFAAAAFLWSWTPVAKPPPSSAVRKFGRRDAATEPASR
jgi:protein-S-isoprenylcysteine O-methyltransferase Ste14